MIQILATVTSNNGLGERGQRLLSNKPYFKWLKKHTKDTVVVVGNKTNEQGIFKDLLFLKEVKVLTSGFGDGDVDLEGILDEEQIISKEEIMELSKTKTISILGGYTCYKEFIDEAKYIRLAELDGIVPTDTFFPNFNRDHFKVVGLNDFEIKYQSGVFKDYKRIGDEKDG